MTDILKHIINLYESGEQTKAEDYCTRVSGEIPTQVYPLFPIKRERAIYSRDCQSEDKKQSKDSCEKIFPSHSKLTPGLYLLTCACAHKSVYGFSMMLSGESPSMLFDLVMTRFEDSYNPTIIYDASCLAKEYGLNRELRRFMRIKICSDRFHQCNHTTCCDSFKSSEYGSLLKINTEAAEQTNSVLRRLTTSTTYMSPMLYPRSLKLFFADFNHASNKT